MNIYAKNGTKVTVTEKSMQNGYPSDSEWCAKHLKIGEIYTVDHTDVHNWNTDVYLKEFPNKSFNSVNLVDINEEEEE